MTYIGEELRFHFIQFADAFEQPLQFDSFFCSQFQFSTPKLDEWMMKYG